MKSEVVIIGAGVTGLAAGMELKDRAVILEKKDTVGGTVFSRQFGNYWFDSTVHFLQFRNKEVSNRMMPLLGDIFKHTSLEVWVESQSGRVRYPFQLNLGGLDDTSAAKCLFDFYHAICNHHESSSYKEFLENTFGKAMCEMFFFPYNEKCWKYPLEDMTSSGQTWNIHQPSLTEVLEGIAKPNITRGKFNTQGYYPIAPECSSVRGMGILPQLMAEEVSNLNLSSNVLYIIPERKKVVIKHDNYDYDKCLSTIPLPKLMKLCFHVPKSLMEEVDKLRWNKILSIAFSVKGERPTDTGHYCYYSDPKIPFNKLTYMTEFDPLCAPENGFGLLLEMKEPNGKHLTETEIYDQVIRSLFDLDVFNDTNLVIDSHIWEIDPAYVIFTKDTQRIVDDCKEYLQQFGITTGGRYGNWEYSSMAENIEDGFNFAKKITK
jgi:protoporphyrinogen oxidase